MLWIFNFWLYAEYMKIAVLRCSAGAGANVHSRMMSGPFLEVAVC